MKRAVIVGVFVAVVAWAWTFLAAQSQPAPGVPVPTRPEPPSIAPEPVAPPTFGPPAAPPTEAQPPVGPRHVSPPPGFSLPVYAEPPVAPQRDERLLSPLQQRFIQLSTKKARSLSPEQLQKAVNELDQEVIELDAWSKVEESARLLRDVAEKFPQTAAGNAAKAALKSIDQHRSANELSPKTDQAPFPGPRENNLLNQRPFERPSPAPKV